MGNATTKTQRRKDSHEGKTNCLFLRGFLRVFVPSWLILLFAGAARAEEPKHWSFRNHVQPVLAKFGCSSGACHGAAAGKNGFRLSLRGYDDEGDFIALTRNSMG